MDTHYQKVLVVEDDAALRRTIARNLEARNHDVSEAESVDEALVRLASERPDLLLLDINLPDRTGWDVLRELRNQGGDVPTIIISAVRLNPARIEEFRPLAYLPKPFLLEALLRLVGDGRPSHVKTEGARTRTAARGE